ncbi:MAG: porin family protein [Alphaproteobacteria bacterium]|nr:porin family protein [Alphaproteobacteria bacterium]
MKKITILLTTALFVAAGFEANADSYNYRPYVGIDYLFNQTAARKYNPHYNVAGVRVGSDYSKYFATELFANQSNRDKRTREGQDFKTSFYGYGLDILAFLPICSEDKLFLTATAGIGEYGYKTKLSPTARRTEHGYGYRFGGGIKYAINEHWQTRLIGRYIHFDQVSGYKYAAEYSLGVEYHF